MLQVFHGRQGPSEPREGKADRDRGHMVRPWRKQKMCADILREEKAEPGGMTQA
jgi:hypothetical protein